MAYVAISKDLIERVETTISNMRNQEVTAACPSKGRNSAEDASAIYNRAAWGEHLHLLDSIPKAWLSKIERGMLSVKGVHTTPERAFDVEAGVIFDKMTTAYARPRSGWASDNVSLSLDAVRALPQDTPGRAALITRWEEACVEREINIKWEKVRQDMVVFLKKCKSLNEAVKLFPNVKLYLDRSDIARMERKVERADRTKLVEEIDSDGITAAAVAAKLMAAV